MPPGETPSWKKPFSVSTKPLPVRPIPDIAVCWTLVPMECGYGRATARCPVRLKQICLRA